MRDVIVIVTDSNEPNVPAVLEYLCGEKVFRLDTDSLIGSLLTMRIKGSQMRLVLARETEIVSAANIKSIWYRRPGEVSISSPELTTEAKRFAEKETQRFLMAAWYSHMTKNIIWMNHPLNLRKIELNKPLQLQTASRAGLQIPGTLITNDRKAAQEFIKHCRGRVIMKTCGNSAISSESGEPLGVFTNLVSREDLDQFGDDLKYAPVIFQNYVSKRLELRITVVGRKIFSCAIHSQDSPVTKIDWRHYDLEKVKHEPYQLPEDVSAKLLRCMKIWGLQFGAIDMILTPDGEYIFLEINPSGQWGWIEGLTGMPISRAIAEFLSSPGEYSL